MILSEIHLSHLRNFSKKTISFSPHTTFIHGANGAGKTNILEAVFSMATGKSFRADTDREMISWGSEIARMKGFMEDLKLELVVTSGNVGGADAPLKKYLVNGVPRRMLDFAGNLKAVLFWPEDMELVTDSPSLRRRYMDRVLIQVDREYRRNIISYERGLRQRNKLLEAMKDGIAHRSQLLFWNQLLIKTGNSITDARADYLKFINHQSLRLDSGQVQKNNKVGVNYREFQIEYDKSVISQMRLEQYKDEEVAAKATLVGPHRDDFTFRILNSTSEIQKEGEVNFVDLSKYGSRGEQRLGVLWLKLAELAFIQEKTNDRPILLLDDIFSELDDAHRKLVLSLISRYQTILTSAEDDTQEVLDNADITYEVIEL